jgi:hypothetical protein
MTQCSGFYRHYGEGQNPLGFATFRDSGSPLCCARNDGPLITSNEKKWNIGCHSEEANPKHYCLVHNNRPTKNLRLPNARYMFFAASGQTDFQYRLKTGFFGRQYFNHILENILFSIIKLLWLLEVAPSE